MRILNTAFNCGQHSPLEKEKIPSPENLIKMPISDSVGVLWGLKFCISNSPPVTWCYWPMTVFKQQRAEELKVMWAWLNEYIHNPINVFLTAHFRHTCHWILWAEFRTSPAILAEPSIIWNSVLFSASLNLFYSSSRRLFLPPPQFYDQKTWNNWSASPLCQPYAYLEKLSKLYTVLSFPGWRYHNSDPVASVETVHLSSCCFPPSGCLPCSHMLFHRGNPHWLSVPLSLLKYNFQILHLP